MSDEWHRGANPPSEALTSDRRRAIARYVQFRDLPTQQRLTAAAEHSYQALVGSDSWARSAQIEDPTAPPPIRKGLFRRSRHLPTPSMLPTTQAFAMVNRLTADIPRELDESPNGCSASRGVAQALASVAIDLVRELLALSPDQQAAHPAYRQTLRLAAELEGLRDVVLTQACTDPEGCVGITTPGHLDRRIEDAEVAEVRAVLLQLARAAEAEQPGV
jgi:hypothetical protein